MSAGRSLRFGVASAGVLAAGVACAAMAATLPQFGSKPLLMIIAAAGVVLLALLSRGAKEVFLGAYIIALGYNRQYFSFNVMFGDNGAHGLYWVPADPLLLLLFAVSALEAIAGRVPPAPSDRSFAGGAGPALPFLAAICTAALFAERPDLAFNDVARVAKLVLLMIWLHRNLTPRLWLTAAAALGLSVLLQSAIGVVQVLTHSGTSLLSMFGAEPSNDLGLEIENRARGTLGHPNYLAPYLLTLLPGAFGAALFSRNILLKLAAFVITLAGIAGVIATQSRAPAALLGLALVGVAILAVPLRALSLRGLVGGGLFALVAGAAVLVPNLDAVRARLFGDLAASIQFREEYNDAALAMWNEHPLLGVGPNNESLDLPFFAPRLASIVKELEQFQSRADIRASAPVHNVYLLMLAEDGIIGLAAFLMLLFGTLRRGVYATAASEGAVRGICLGLCVGLVADFAQQGVDFSLWFDPSWYTLGLLAGMLGMVPAVAPKLA
jgi:putative inorganic carbon (HCO3(-)) transporter